MKEIECAYSQNTCFISKSITVGIRLTSRLTGLKSTKFLLISHKQSSWIQTGQIGASKKKEMNNRITPIVKHVWKVANAMCYIFRVCFKRNTPSEKILRPNQPRLVQKLKMLVTISIISLDAIIRILIFEPSLCPIYIITQIHVDWAVFMSNLYIIFADCEYLSALADTSLHLLLIKSSVFFVERCTKACCHFQRWQNMTNI